MTKDQKKKKNPDEITKKTQMKPSDCPIGTHTVFTLDLPLSSLSPFVAWCFSTSPYWKPSQVLLIFCLCRCNTWDGRTNAPLWLCERKREGVSGCRRLLLGQWLSSAAARACAVAGGSYSLGYCRRWLGFDFFPLSLSLSLWVFLFFFFILRKLLWDFTSGRTVENKFFNLVLVNFSSHV